MGLKFAYSDCSKIPGAKKRLTLEVALETRWLKGEKKRCLIYWNAMKNINKFYSLRMQMYRECIRQYKFGFSNSLKIFVQTVRCLYVTSTGLDFGYYNRFIYKSGEINYG